MSNYKQYPDAEINELKAKIKHLEAQVKDNEDERIADMMVVRGEWEKSEKKLLAKLKASNDSDDSKSNQLEVAGHSLMEAQEQSAYWEDAWGKAVEQHLRDEVVMQGKVIDLQTRVINFIDR